MKNIGTFLFLLHVLAPCTAFYASPVIKISGRALQTANLLEQAAAILNVTEPGKVKLNHPSMLK